MFDEPEDTDRTRSATELYVAEIDKLNRLLKAGAIDQEAYARAVEGANGRMLRSSQTWTDGATRFLQGYVAESQDAATATERVLSSAFAGAEDALVSFAIKDKLEFRGLADSIVADISRMAVRQAITAPIAGLLQGAVAGGEFGLFHDGGVVGGMPTATRCADPAIFNQAPRYHTGSIAGGGLLSDEVPIIARRGELVVPPKQLGRSNGRGGIGRVSLPNCAPFRSSLYLYRDSVGRGASRERTLVWAHRAWRRRRGRWCGASFRME